MHNFSIRRRRSQVVTRESCDTNLRYGAQHNTHFHVRWTISVTSAYSELQITKCYRMCCIVQHSLRKTKYMSSKYKAVCTTWQTSLAWQGFCCFDAEVTGEQVVRPVVLRSYRHVTYSRLTCCWKFVAYTSLSNLDQNSLLPYWTQVPIILCFVPTTNVQRTELNTIQHSLVH